MGEWLASGSGLARSDLVATPSGPSSLPPQVTGSGKTLAFVIPILEILLRREEKLKKGQVRKTGPPGLALLWVLTGAWPCPLLIRVMIAPTPWREPLEPPSLHSFLFYLQTWE